MKKIIALALAAIMVCSLAACGSNSGTETKGETKATNAETKNETQTEAKADETQAPETAATETAEADEATGAQSETGEASADNGGKLIMATEAGFAPYEYTEDGETVIGVDVDIANEIAKAMGRELEIQNMSFDGALMAVQQGTVDFAAAGISVTDER